MLSWLSPQEQTELLSEIEPAALEYDWEFWARPHQLPPPGEWLIWLILTGRGWGKTRCGAETVKGWVCGPTPLAPGRFRRLALVAETAADARDVMVEGESGILSVHPKEFRPLYEPSKRRLTWPNGASASLYNATEPDQLRGPQFDAAWSDELAKWQYARETFDMLQFGMRLGHRPQQLITTTPRPIPVVKELLARIAPDDVVVTRGSTMENRANLAMSFLTQIERRYAGTRLGRQELDGEVIEDNPNALWTRDMLDLARKDASGKPFEKAPDLARIVVAIDPSGTDGADEGCDVGIVVAGRGVDGEMYVLADLTCQLSPAGWGKVAVEGYKDFEGNAIIGEANFGGAMVEHVIRTIDPRVPYKEVRASRGKWLRAEPVAALYEQRRVHHVGSKLSALEDEMCAFGPDGLADGKSPNRLDALVWAATELMLGDGTMTFSASEADILEKSFDIPRHWPRVFALDMDLNRVAAVWGAIDRASDTVWLTGEYVARRADLAVHAAAIRDRCAPMPELPAWIPGVFDPRARKRGAEEGERIVSRLLGLNLDLFTIEGVETEALLGEVATRLSAKRLRVFSELREWLSEYRNSRRDQNGALVEANDGLIRATGLLCLSGVHIAITDRVLDQETRDEASAMSRDTVTGY